MTEGARGDERMSIVLCRGRRSLRARLPNRVTPQPPLPTPTPSSPTESLPPAAVPPPPPPHTHTHLHGAHGKRRSHQVHVDERGLHGLMPLAALRVRVSE